MAAENNTNLARYPPPLPPSPPSPHGHTAVIVIVFISLGSCLFFFAFVAAAICCFIKKRKEKSCRPQEVAEVVRIDGHRKVHEDVAQGAHGEKAVVVTIEDDVHIDEIVKKKLERRHGHGHGLHEGSNSSTMDVEASSSSTLDSNVRNHQS